MKTATVLAALHSVCHDTTCHVASGKHHCTHGKEVRATAVDNLEDSTFE